MEMLKISFRRLNVVDFASFAIKKSPSIDKTSGEFKVIIYIASLYQPLLSPKEFHLISHYSMSRGVYRRVGISPNPEARILYNLILILSTIIY